MQEKSVIVVTSISGPNRSLQSVARGSIEGDYHFIVIGDVLTPSDFQMQGCDFYSLEQQRQLGSKFAECCPTRCYARKNIGYVLAMRNGADIIIDMDDDCIPYETFWSPRQRIKHIATVEGAGWVNIYRYFSKAHIWPRGFPLNQIRSSPPPIESLVVVERDCVIQQGLVNKNPDVDAIYRLLLPLPHDFMIENRVALGKWTWCPFNSQNTTWWSDAFPLLYLPAYCSFRMSDIWRSFVAQRIAWENRWSIAFHKPTVCQERNGHDLMQDFAEEVPGYLHNERICEELMKLPIKGGRQNLTADLSLCYEILVDKGWLKEAELDLLRAWIEDLESVWP
jgi:hypothetical protein